MQRPGASSRAVVSKSTAPARTAEGHGVKAERWMDGEYALQQQRRSKAGWAASMLDEERQRSSGCGARQRGGDGTEGGWSVVGLAERNDAVCHLLACSCCSRGAVRRQVAESSE